MKKLIISICAMIIAIGANAQIDSIVESQQLRIRELETQVNELRQTDAQLKKTDDKLKLRVDEVDGHIKALRAADEETAGTIVTTSNELNKSIQGVSEQAKGDTNKVSNDLFITIVVGSIMVLLVLLVSLVLYFVMKKRNMSAFDKIKAAQASLEEESLKLDEKLVEILDKQLAIQKADPTQSEPDHSLALKVADEIVRIETNLSRMDSSVKGYKQLSASVRRIKDNFLANGYEMVDMLGKPYNDGMKVIANFVPDETLKEGEQIITGIIKPQINYNGVMIQAAQITVSQN